MTSKGEKGLKDSAGSVRVDEIIDALAATGMAKGIARTLAFLTTQDGWTTSKDIEDATKLRQPEVSIAVRTLVERGWVERDNLKRESKGRPICIYRMAVDLRDVYRSIEADEEIKIAGVKANLASIKGLWSVG
jgi:predicted transcriptional regulator